MVATRLVAACACIAFAFSSGQDGQEGGARAVKWVRPAGEALAGVWVQYCGYEDEHRWDNGGMYRVALRDGQLEMKVESLRDESPGMGETSGLSDVKFDGTTWRFRSAWPEGRTGVFELRRVAPDLFEGNAYATDGLTPPQRELWKKVSSAEDGGPIRTGAFTDLESETRKEFTTAGALTMLWWIPPEFFDLVLDSVAPAHGATVRAMASVAVFAIVDGRPPAGAGTGAAPGASRYRSVDEIRPTLKLVAPDGSASAPLDDTAEFRRAAPLVEPLARALLRVPDSVRAQVRFFYFPIADANGAPKFTARSGGDLTLLYDGARLQWHLPLSSIVPGQRCPACHEAVSGGYRFCPWDGTKLTPPVPR